jgi:ATP-dependent exoDNAse (exonuclease V) alpha subunit
VQKLGEAGMTTSTLQHHLARGERPETGEKLLYVLDESSLASTRQMHEFLSRLHRNDRVLLVGDVRQHEGVEAGRPFAQLQEAGMHTVKLDEILRQRDQPNDILHYSRTSKETGIGKGEYARVLAVNGQENLLTVLRGNGEQITYDPRRQLGVSVYRTEERSFAIGDRVQLTAPNRELTIANRELASVESIPSSSSMRLKLDSGRSVEFGMKDFPHLDHGYSVTSHSSQG